ncbi:MAG: hypothetical protein Q9165_008909 [Trypethelium subeluteriae]
MKDDQPRSLQRPVRMISHPHYLLIGLAGILLWELTLSIKPPAGSFASNSSQLSSHEDLQYASCFEGLQCARLSLPLDWWNGTTSKNISLAVLRLPAKVPVTDPRYGGPILVNPGGPGGSGVYLVEKIGHQLQDLVDYTEGPNQTLGNTQAKYFDVLGFDPRGIGASEPTMQCFQGLSVSQTWALRTMSEGIINSSDASLGRLWSMAHAVGASCSANLEDYDIKTYGSTASAARDMLELVEKHGKWRDLEARKQLRQGSCRASVPQKFPARLQHLQYKPGEEKILYWGFSYGSFLGSTFAAMFPSRIERLALDAVVDAPDYVQQLWTDNLVDTEKVVQSFFESCAAAGPDRCAFTSKGAKPADLKAKLEDILAKLLHNPLPVTGETPEVITHSDIKNLFFASLYTPIGSFPYMANLLADIDCGNGTAFASLLRPYHTFSCPSPRTDRIGMVFEPLYNESGLSSPYASQAIACGDGDPQTNMTLDAFDEYWQHLQTLSPSVGAMWSEIRLSCSAWAIRPLYRFTGPYEANTSSPILWIGNTADPVTPLRSAIRMSKGFPGSVVLTQDSPGHSSLAAFSNCTTAFIRQYFQAGSTPPPGTVCQPNELPFGNLPANSEMNADMQSKAYAHRKIRQALQEDGFGFMRKNIQSNIQSRILDII